MVLFSSSAAPSADRVQNALRSASAATGTGFDYLMTTAGRESAFDPTAKAATSSAAGLFQFLDSTWMQTVKEDGPAFGLQAYADAIQRTTGGRYVAADPAARQAVLALREDPEVSALMAGAFTRRNRDQLTAALGRAPSDGELYIAHFMGASGGAGLIRLAASDGAANAAGAFPVQAAANPSIFYDKAGRARSAAEVYGGLVKPFEAGASGPAAIASAGADQGAAAVGPAVWLAIPARNAYAAESRTAAAAAGPFQSLFRTDGAAPISNAVAATWSGLGPALATTAPAATSAPVELRSVPTAAPVHAPQPQAEAPATDLFSAIGAFFSGIFSPSDAAPVALGKRGSS
ncbi:lytic transglycosylase domain-containing protein [Labrys wisconsinensis]|uniref:Transglycosylase SLT domain-containing protein n=1 Tax=Labrys wisconsinensis TaxID=425677 RepID=A0ABU0JER4_9HYPH|nr:lytic transglycosylase domain-containing protein [Labrys wisconsinensis]MDQ0472759.1 hypothetical protein [Labrys wisconsinensis]